MGGIRKAAWAGEKIACTATRTRPTIRKALRNRDCSISMISAVPIMVTAAR